jgi:hypothetical protein
VQSVGAPGAPQRFRMFYLRESGYNFETEVGLIARACGDSRPVVERIRRRAPRARIACVRDKYVLAFGLPLGLPRTLYRADEGTRPVRRSFRRSRSHWSDGVKEYYGAGAADTLVSGYHRTRLRDGNDITR